MPRIEDVEFTDKDKLEYDAGHLLSRAFKVARKHMLSRLSEYDLTPVQTSAIHALMENGATSQNKLGRYIGMEPGNMHGLVERLMKKNLISSRRDEDDVRYHVLELTDEGIDIASVVIPLRFLASEDILTPLNNKERKRFLELLVKVSKG